MKTLLVGFKGRCEQKDTLKNNEDKKLQSVENRHKTEQSQAW